MENNPMTTPTNTLARFWVSCTDALDDWDDIAPCPGAQEMLRDFYTHVHRAMQDSPALGTPSLTFASTGALVFTTVVHAESQADAVVLAKDGFNRAWESVGGTCDLPDYGSKAWRTHSLRDARTTVVTLAAA